MKKRAQPEKKPHHKINWYEDKYQSVLVWRNWLYVITLLSLIGITTVCGVLFFMLPLKGVAPFVIQVDEKSGLSEIVNKRSYNEYSANAALIKYFSMTYISARENYDYDSFRQSLEVVRVMSSPDVAHNYSLKVQQDNPESPLNTMAEHTNRSIDLISFAILNTNEASGESIAQARLKVVEVGGTRVMDEYYAVATISCYFEKNLELNEKERLINPLGFRVTSYKIDREIEGKQK